MNTNPEVTQMTELVDNHVKTVNITIFSLFQEATGKTGHVKYRDGRYFYM